MSIKKGFTLIELLVVVAIIGILATIVLASLSSARAQAKISAGRQFEANVYHAAGDQAVGMWDFNECTGGVANDSSGLGNNGTLTNMLPAPVWSSSTPQGTGCAIFFDGTDDFVSVPNSSALNFNATTSLTISAWFKAPQNRGSTRSIVNKWQGTNGAQYALYLRVTTGKVAGEVAGLSQTPDVPIVSNNAYDDDVWHNAVFVRDTTAHLLYLYVDGISVATPVSDTTGDLTNTDLFQIGKLGGGNIFSGYIDNVRIFAKSLTASEISNLYAAGLKTHNVADK